MEQENWTDKKMDWSFVKKAKVGSWVPFILKWWIIYMVVTTGISWFVVADIDIEEIIKAIEVAWETPL